MNTLFCDNLRMLSESELRYQVSNRKETANDTELSFEDFLETLTPGRKAMALALIELYKRTRNVEKKTVTRSRDIYECMQELGYLEHEECWVLYLSQALKVIRKVRIGVGGLTSTVVDVRVILREALKCNAVAMALVHNHPSGSLRPSKEDDRLTAQVAQSGQIMNVRLMDHVIITEGAYYSYADEGKI